MEGRCPACAEQMPPLVLFRHKPCPHCMESPAQWRVDGQAIAAGIEHKSKKQVLVVAAIVAASHLVLGWMPLTGALALVLAAVWIRVGIINPAAKVLSPTRAMLMRWTARLIVGVLVAVTVIFSEALTLLGPLGLPVKAVLSAGEVIIAALGVTAYVNWQVRREASHQPVEAWEWAILIGCLLLLGAAAAAIAIAAVFIATALTELSAKLIG